jgi:hypothetical protein
MNESRKASVERTVQDAVDRQKIISFKTYYLSDYGEMVLHTISRLILAKFGREDLLDMVYTAAKELVINATKANLKRALFADLNLDPTQNVQYEQGMIRFKEQLRDDRIKDFEERFRELNIPVIATFYYRPDVLNIKVKNMFSLFSVEENRIRQKFAQAKSFSSLLDFYTEHGDDTEGAGLGITMVGIMLDSTAVDKHALTLYSNEFNETAAKLEIPLSASYIPKRKRFDIELEALGGEAFRDRLRGEFRKRSYF